MFSDPGLLAIDNHNYLKNVQRVSGIICFQAKNTFQKNKRNWIVGFKLKCEIIPAASNHLMLFQRMWMMTCLHLSSF